MDRTKLQTGQRPYPERFLVPRRGGTAVLSCLTLLVALLLSGPVLAQQVELSDDVYDVAELIRCPVCQAESVAGSNSEISISMRQEIARQLSAGKSKAEILDYFEERYGTWILMTPPKRGVHLLVWLLPAVGGLGALVALVFFFRRWTQQARVPVEAAPEELERVRRLKGER